MCDVIVVRDSQGEPILCDCTLERMFAAVRRGDMAPPVFSPVPAAVTVTYSTGRR